MEKLTDTELVILARSGDKTAFAMLIGRYDAMAKRLVQRTISQVDASTKAELVQEAFLQAYLSLPQLRDPDRFRSWFYGLVLNVCRTHLRELNFTTLSLESLMGGVLFEGQLLADESANPEQLILQQENQQLVAQALQSLSPKNLAVVALFYYAQMSLKEIALSLNISLIAVKSRLHKARRELKAHLKEAYPQRLALPLLQARPLPALETRTKSMLRMLIAEIIRQNATSLVILIDEAGEVALPITIGNAEGDAIATCLQTNPTPRPLTFGFMANLLSASGAKLVEVRIEALKEGTFYAITKLESAGQTHELDARPADALALSAYTATPIYVSQAVIQQAGLKLEPVEASQPSQPSVPVLTQLLAKLRQKTPTVPSALDYSILPLQPRNLDFREGWEGWEQVYPDQYEYGLESQTREGQPGAFIRLKGGERELNAFGGLLQAIRAENYRGKRFRLVGYLKASQVEGLAHLWVRVDLPRSTPNFSSQFNHPLSGTSDWQPFEVVFEVDEEAVGFQFGINLEGRGQLQLSGLKLEEVSKELALSVYQSSSKAEQPRNLDFSEGLKYWVFSNQDYEDGIEPQISWNNKPVAFLRSKVANPKEFATTAQHFIPKGFLGQRVRLSAVVKAESVQGWAGLWMRVDGSEERKATLAFDNMQDRAIKGSQEWQRYEIVLDVPAESINLSFGLLLRGKGQVWWSEVKLEAVGPEVATTGVGQNPKPRNLDFSDALNGWYLNGSHPQDYEDGIAPEVLWQGLAVAYLKSRVDKPGGFATTNQGFVPAAYQGRRVRLSAYIKSENVIGWSGLYMRVDGEDRRKSLGFDNMQNRPIKGTTEWQRYEIVLDVPVEAVYLAFGLILSGSGQVWWSNLQFEIVGQETETTLSALSLNPTELSFEKDSWSFVTLDPDSYHWENVADARRKGFGGALIEGRMKEWAGFGQLAQSVAASTFRYQRVRLSGYLKAEGVKEWGGLILHTSDDKQLLEISTMLNNPLKGTQDWQKYAVEIEVSGEAISLVYGAILLGGGKLWLADLQLEIL